MHWMHVRQGRAHRSFCVLAWTISGLYVFLQSGGLETLLTQKALIFFLGGIVAAWVFGMFGAWVHKVLVQAVLIALRPSGDAAMGLIRILGLVVFVGEALAVYHVAIWAFAQNWGTA